MSAGQLLTVVALGSALGLAGFALVQGAVHEGYVLAEKWILRWRLPSLLRRAEVEREIARERLVAELTASPCGCGAPECDRDRRILEGFDHITKQHVLMVKAQLEFRAGILRAPEGSPVGFELSSFRPERGPNCPPVEP